MLPRHLRDLIEYFDALPGVGPRQAARFVFALLRMPNNRVRAFGEALRELPEATQRCERCARIMESNRENLCAICCDDKRDPGILCIVATDQNLEALEETKSFNGLYHVLGGHIEPIEEKKNEQLTLPLLFDRLQKETPSEIIIATDSTTEGETTALELIELLRPLTDAPISRLGRGLSTGSEIEYMDAETLRNALKHRARE